MKSILYNNHPALERIVCLAEQYRLEEKRLESAITKGVAGYEKTTFYAIRQMLDRELEQWRRAIEANPSAFSGRTSELSGGNP